MRNEKSSDACCWKSCNVLRFHTYADAGWAIPWSIILSSARPTAFRRCLISLQVPSLAQEPARRREASQRPSLNIPPTLCEAETKPGGEEMKTEYTSLELRVISCQDLRAFNFFQRLSVFVRVSIVDGDGLRKRLHPDLQQRQRTPTSKGGHRNPEWNHAVGFDLSGVSPREYSALRLKFDVRLPSIVGSRSIGQVRFSLQELVDEFNGAVQFRRWQVRNDDGKGVGVLKFTYKLCGKSAEAGDELALINPSSKASVLVDNAPNFGYLEWPSLHPSMLSRGISNSQTYSSSLSLKTTNKKDVNRASTGSGYRQS